MRFWKLKTNFPFLSSVPQIDFFLYNLYNVVRLAKPLSFTYKIISIHEFQSLF